MVAIPDHTHFGRALGLEALSGFLVTIFYNDCMMNICMYTTHSR